MDLQGGMSVNRCKRWLVGGAVAVAALSGGTVAASSYPPGDPTPSTVATGGVAGDSPARGRTGRRRTGRDGVGHRHDVARGRRRGRVGRRIAGRRTYAAARTRPLTIVHGGTAGDGHSVTAGHVAHGTVGPEPASAPARGWSPPPRRSLLPRPRRSRPALQSPTSPSSPPGRRRSSSSGRPHRGGPPPSRPAPRWPSPATPLLMLLAALALAAALWAGATRRDRPEVLAALARSDPQRPRSCRARCQVRGDRADQRRGDRAGRAHRISSARRRGRGR